MLSPYKNTIIGTTVSLRPDQMDNNVYINLKKNLEDNVLGKCYRQYGYIQEIFELIKYEDGYIETENLSGSAKFNVLFSCKLCRPTESQQIICKIEKANRVLITGKNGPITIIITGNNINENIFFTDTKKNRFKYKKDGESKLLETGDYVKVTVLKFTFNHNGSNIMAICYLDDIPTDKEIEESFLSIHDKTNFVDISEII